MGFTSGHCPPKCGIDQTGSNSKMSGLYSVGVQSESQPGHQLS
jgi:hypothetical protein